MQKTGFFLYAVVVGFLILAAGACTTVTNTAPPNNNSPVTPTRSLPSTDPTQVVPTWQAQTCPASVLATRATVKMGVGNLVVPFSLTPSATYLYAVGANITLATAGRADVDFGAGNKMTLNAPQNGVGIMSVTEWDGVRSIALAAGSAYVNEDQSDPHCRMEVTVSGAKLVATGTEYAVVVVPAAGGQPESVQIGVLTGTVQVTDKNQAVTTLSSGPANQNAVILTDGIAAAPISLSGTPTAIRQALGQGQDLFQNPVQLDNFLPVRLWYVPGGAEQAGLADLLGQAQTAFPEAKIQAEPIPQRDLNAKWQTALAAGIGPDLLLAPNDQAGAWAAGGEVLNLDTLMAGHLVGFSPNALAGLTVHSSLFGLPESVVAAALYYNTARLPNPPKTTDELLALVKKGNPIVISPNVYPNFGFFSAFGGKLLDDKGSCIASETGFAVGMQYLLDLKQAGAIVASPADADNIFKATKADMIINGPWALADYRAALGDQLGVASLPAGQQGPASPLVGVEGVFINAKGANPGEAVALAQYLTNREAAQGLTKLVGYVPARTDVDIADAATAAFAAAAAAGYPALQRPELGDHFFTPFNDMVAQVLAGKQLPKDGVASACAKMNKSNNK